MDGIVRNPNSDERAGAAPVIAILMKKELLGDAITHVPALRALRIACPDHRIIGIYKGETVWTASLSRVKHEFFDDIWINTPARDRIWTIRDVLKRIPGLAIVVDFQSNGRTLLSYFATFGMGVRYVANIAGFVLRRGVTRQWMFRPRSNAQRYHRIAELVAGRILPFNATMQAEDGDHRLAERLVGHIARFMCLVPGPSFHAKFWVKDGWIRLARHLIAKGITPVFLLGPTEDHERDWVRDNIDGAVIIDRNAVERIEQLPWLFIALAGRSMGAVSYEGGIGHLIATTGMPLLTIAGPTNAGRWQPVTANHWVASSQEYGSTETARVPFEDVAARLDEMIGFSERIYRPRSETVRDQSEDIFCAPPIKLKA